MKYLAEWRQQINLFLTKHKDIILKANKVLDIGAGDSTNVLRSFREISILDKIKHKDRIYGDILDINTLYPIVSEFDLIVCCEVFEHCENPFTAAHNIKTLLGRGGTTLITVPCNLEWHPGQPHYGDYWRFMPGSLKLLFDDTLKERQYNSPDNNFPYGLSGVYIKP